MRHGLVVDDGPYEGVPAHAEAALNEWLRVEFGWHRPMNRGGVAKDLIRSVAAAVRVPLVASPDSGQLWDSLMSYAHSDDEVYLDILDATLFLTGGRGSRSLREILRSANSVWTVSDGGTALERRVDVGSVAAKNEVISVQDLASVELAEAWKKCFSRDADPSDAWDHAAKAVEAILIPVVVPAQAKPHLGHVLGRLRSQKDSWRLALPGAKNDYSIEALIGMLDLIWPNPDRHASEGGRNPTPQEAQAVVHLAITIVQWARSDVLQLVEK